MPAENMQSIQDTVPRHKTLLRLEIDKADFRLCM